MCLKTSKDIQSFCSMTLTLCPIHLFGSHTWLGNLTGITWDGHFPYQIYHDCNWQEYSKHLQGISMCERLDYDSKEIDHFWRCLHALLRRGWQACKKKAVSFWVCSDKPLVYTRQRVNLSPPETTNWALRLERGRPWGDRMVLFIIPNCPPLHTCPPPREGHIHT